MYKPGNPSSCLVLAVQHTQRVCIDARTGVREVLPAMFDIIGTGIAPTTLQRLSKFTIMYMHRHTLSAFTKVHGGGCLRLRGIPLDATHFMLFQDDSWNDRQ